MTEPIFQIVSKKRQNQHKVRAQTQNAYNNLLQQYVSRSYGYYTELFLKKICENVMNQQQKMRKFQLRKMLREAVQKYLMNDLQVIFLTYFLKLHQWNYTHPVIEQSINRNQANNELNQINKFRLFLYLVCFFVKSYIGSQTQISALIDLHSQNMPNFADIYRVWIANNPYNVFQISPRELNQIYSQHSRNCGQKSHKKDFNHMVDKILDLSTTYSIMPAKQKSIKSKKIIKGSRDLIKQIVPSPQKRSMRNFQSNCLQNSLRLDLSDWRSHQKQSIIISGWKNNSQNGQKIQSRQQNQFLQKIESTNGPKRISLNKKKKLQKDEVNNVAKTFFRGKDIHLSVQDMKKSQNSLKDIIPSSFLDLNNRSSRIQSIPFPYRNNSNIFGPSTLF